MSPFELYHYFFSDLYKEIAKYTNIFISEENKNKINEKELNVTESDILLNLFLFYIYQYIIYQK